MPVSSPFLSVLAGTFSLLLAGCASSRSQTADPFPVEASAYADAQLRHQLEQALTPHPRLLVTDRTLAGIRARVATDEDFRRLHERILASAVARLGDPAPERKLQGPRLLGVSGECLNRFALCAYAWRITGEERFLERVRRDLAAVCAFSDWTPNSFLGTGVMSAGVALAYDWCHQGLDEELRRTVRTALVGMAIAPSFASRQGWVGHENNWNQVCNGGLVLAALAIAEQEPALAEAVIARAERSLPKVMASYGPDGAYAEGPSYWTFGTRFNVMALDALSTALGRRSVLEDLPGFLATGAFYLHVIGPTGEPFLYADSVPGTVPSDPVAWFAQRTGDLAVWFNEAQNLRQRLDRPGATLVPPWALGWMATLPAQVPAPAATHWCGQGVTPVAMHRTGWTPEATWIAIKGGSPSSWHAHMDIGGFALDALGVRWADDLGRQDYHSLESQGIKPLHNNPDESSLRWTVLRMNASSHSVITVDGRPQRVPGHSSIVHHASDRTVVDMGPAYAGQLAAARRGIALLPGGSVLVQDELRARAEAPAQVRWAMTTRAQVAPDGARAVLTRDGRRLELRVLEPAGAVCTVEPLDPPPHPYDVANPGVVQVVFRCALPAGTTARLRVTLMPGGGESGALPPADLAGW
jgi:hypothetical protein